MSASPVSRFLLIALAGLLLLLAGYRLWSTWQEEGIHPATVGPGFRKITSESGLEVDPSLSPDGRFVAYSSRSSGNWDIFRKSLDESGTTNLTEESYDDDTQPAFSPDGRRIAFRSERQGGGIFLMSTDGDSPRRLSDFGYGPAWSPDGMEIVCREGKAHPQNRSPKSRLWVIDVESGEKRRITDADAVSPSWSPNGHRIAYAASRPGGQRDLWSVPAGGGKPLPITDDAAPDSSPVWSPDGKLLYYVSGRRGTARIWRVPVNEETGTVRGEPEPIPTPSSWISGIDISWDGRYLVCASAVATMSLRKLKFDAQTETVLGGPLLLTAATGLAGQPDVSPDGRWLAFVAAENHWDISVIGTDGTGLRRLTQDRYEDRMPRWSPDGQRIAFYSNRSGNYEIWTIQPDGSALQQVTQNPPGTTANHPLWSPDGTRIAYYSRSEANSYIFTPSTPWAEQRPEAMPLLGDRGQHFEVWSWSPDGSRLAGRWRTADGATGGIATYSLESGEYVKLADFGVRPVWLSDRRRLVFEAQHKLFIIDSETKMYHKMFASSAAKILAPTISKDDRNIYFAAQTVEADLWLLTLN